MFYVNKTKYSSIYARLNIIKVKIILICMKN